MQTKSEKASILAKRYLFFVVGLIIMAFGIAFSINAALGTSPISSLPYVTSLILPLTVGQMTILMHVTFITLQTLILKKEYNKVQLLQLPVAIVFGFMTDVALWCMKDVIPQNYFMQWVLCIIGILLVGLGVAVEVTAGVVILAGEGLILAICKAYNKNFAKMKIIFDTSLVVISVVLSLVFLHSLQGVREGTIVAALFVGVVVKLLKPFMNKISEKLFRSKI